MLIVFELANHLDFLGLETSYRHLIKALSSWGKARLLTDWLTD